MPLPPINVQLSNGQQVEVVKRFRLKYSEELEKLENEMRDMLTASTEADFMAKYLGEQPEVIELRNQMKDFDVKEKRRQYLGAIIERLDAVTPKQAPVTVAPPGGGPTGVSGTKPVVRRY